MHKYLISFIVCFLFIALILRNCNSNEDDTESFENNINVEKDNHISDNNKKEIVFTNDKQNESKIMIHNVETQDTLVNVSYLEIPKMTKEGAQQILSRIAYTSSYNNITKNPNWVAWHLTRLHTDGPWSRKGIDYIEDIDVIGKRQTEDDWKDLQYPIDHGHLCPAGDNKWSKETMLQSFLLTNICPQNRTLNRGEWEKLERQCRNWANLYGEVYIVAGPIFYSSNFKTIGYNKIAVPDAFYKVILRNGKNPAAIGFIFPNLAPASDYSYYLLTVDEVEEKTGIDFFYNLPDNIEDDIESIADLKKW